MFHLINNNLTNKEWNGETFTELNKVSTKKKNLIIKKLQLLEEFMLEFLHINQEDTKEQIFTNIDGAVIM